VPLRLLLLKLPVGGATGMLMLLPLLPQAARNRRAESARSRTNPLRTDITSPLEANLRVELVTFNVEVSTGEFTCLEPEPRK
jgi:hypothetical protein